MVFMPDGGPNSIGTIKNALTDLNQEGLAEYQWRDSENRWIDLLHPSQESHFVDVTNGEGTLAKRIAELQGQLSYRRTGRGEELPVDIMQRIRCGLPPPAEMKAETSAPAEAMRDDLEALSKA